MGLLNLLTLLATRKGQGNRKQAVNKRNNKERERERERGRERERERGREREREREREGEITYSTGLNVKSL